jgi:hypothetical protein
MQGGIERAGFNLKQVAGCSLDLLRDGMPVLRAEQQRAQDQQLEGPLQLDR